MKYFLVHIFYLLQSNVFLVGFLKEQKTPKLSLMDVGFSSEKGAIWILDNTA